MAKNPKEPYGDVNYADPGYQQDGKKRYPLDSAEHVRAAWSYINQADNADQYSSEHLAEVKNRIRAAAKKFGVQISDEQGSRSTELVVPAQMFVRSFALQDLAIRSGGDGRTVEAYAAVFDTPAEIVDGQGHYVEVIDRAAFNRTIANNASRVGVFYNHGMNLYGTPSDRFSIPIGTPEAIRADNRGLLTVTRFNNTPQADEVLEAIRSGGIAGYSFTGRLIRSDPTRPPRGGFQRDGHGNLRTVRRFELGLQEYGPTPMPAYNEAAIVGVRAALREELREELRGLLSTTPDDLDPEDSVDTPADAGPVADDPLIEHSVRLSPFRRRLQVALRARGIQP